MRAKLAGCAVLALAFTPVAASAEPPKPAQKPATLMLAKADRSAKQAATGKSSCAVWAQDVAPFNPATAKVLEAKCKARRK